MSVIGLAGALLLFSSSALAHVFYQSVDRHGHVYLSDKPLKNTTVKKRYRISIPDRSQHSPQPIAERREGATNPTPTRRQLRQELRVLYTQLDIANHQLQRSRMQNAMNYRHCLDTYRERRDLGAALEVLCLPDLNVLYPDGKEQILGDIARIKALLANMPR